MNITAKQLRLYAVTDRHWLNGQRLEDVVEELLAAGVTCLQLREKHQDPAEFARMARALKPICARYGVPLILNDAVELAKEVDADGVHVGQDDMSVARARPLRPIRPGRTTWAAVRCSARPPKRMPVTCPKGSWPGCAPPHRCRWWASAASLRKTCPG